jgi:nucleotide-binding universal stress UspA family protein
VQATAAEAGAALLKKARQAKADLLVMGAYGHSPLREQLLGGATQYVLMHATLATWLAH